MGGCEQIRFGSQWLLGAGCWLVMVFMIFSLPVDGFDTLYLNYHFSLFNIPWMGEQYLLRIRTVNNPWVWYKSLHIEARPLLLHPALPLPFLATLELDSAVDSSKLERHAGTVIYQYI
jgi:hypothetical protein